MSSLFISVANIAPLELDLAPSAANLDLYDLDLDLWQYSLDRKKII